MVMILKKNYKKKSFSKDFLQWIDGKQLTTYSSIPGDATFPITGYHDHLHGFLVNPEAF